MAGGEGLLGAARVFFFPAWGHIYACCCPDLSAAYVCLVRTTVPVLVETVLRHVTRLSKANE